MSSSETPAKDAPPPEPSAAAEPASTDNTQEKDEESISFTVKSIADNKIPMTVNRFITVKELKEKLSEPSSIPADRQRLIYSGRVLKDDQTVDSYKIQSGHTVHLVKGAASTASAARGNVGGSSASTSGTGAAGSAGGSTPNQTPQLPSMAAGTGTNPLSRLTNHIPLPSADFFGPDGGQMLGMLESPEVRASMNALLQNPALLDSLIQSNPMLQAMGPDARRMMQSEEFRAMMTDPTIIRQMSQFQRMMGAGPFGRGGLGGGAGAFPAPGVTDQTPADQQAQGQTGQTTGAAGTGAGAGQNPATPPTNPFAALFNPLGNAGNAGSPFGTPPQPPTGGAAGNQANPFMFLNPALFGGMRPPQAPGQTQTQTPAAGAQTTGGDQPQQQPQQPQNPLNPFMPNMDLNQLQNMMQILGMAPGGEGAGGLGGLGGLGGGFGAPPAPVDNRPPEERYADQLRQLNDMGFFDFDRNVTALRRSGGSVQGAVDYLLSNL
ncbi:Ubiquilin [Arthrobotrys entomopaga]|nr:Ubiquilin [Arthrobotrys entomopaga]